VQLLATKRRAPLAGLSTPPLDSIGALLLLGFTIRRTGTAAGELSGKEGVTAYLADPHLLMFVTVLLFLRQVFSPVVFH
jgi:hypothetical protein